MVRSTASETAKPFCGAAPLMVTLPVIVPPPYAGSGRTEKPVKLSASIVSVADWVLVPTVAEIDDVVFAPDV